MTTPSTDQASGDEPVPPAISDITLQLWVLALLIAELTITCWWFGRMFAT